MAKTAAFNILTVYETLDAALRVKEMSDRLAADLQPSCKLHCDFWKFDVLTHPSFRGKALAEASAADMIIIAANGDDALLETVKAWFEGWLRKKRPGRAALVALLDGKKTDADERPRLCAYLQEVATRGRMDFFCHSGSWRPAELEYVFQ